MSRETLVVLSLVLAGCGRTDLLEDADGGTPDAGVKPVVVQREAPLFVAVPADMGCGKPGAEGDLKVRESGERLVLMKTKPLDECSGAGGEYLIGTEVNAARDAFLGAHACYFLNSSLRQSLGQVFWGVTRLSQTAAVFMTPTGWCVTSIAGAEPVTSDSKVKAWAVYPAEAAARAALMELSQP
jgi:hypothetical protein